MANKRFISKYRITNFEKAIMAIFFLLLLSTYFFKLDLFETILLVIGVTVGFYALIKSIQLSRDMSKYQKNKQEINAWMTRFVVFKIIPLALPFLIKLF